MIAHTPDLPYYAVIFTSFMSSDTDGYGAMSEQMVAMASEQEGFLGIESARDGLGITVSYWTNLEAIKAWKENAKHLVAQKYGKEKWYSDFMVRIAKVEKQYDNKKGA